MIDRPVSISRETYTFLCEWENLGEPHVTIGGGERWYPAERGSLAPRVLDELREHGLASGNRVSDDFLDAMVISQRAAAEYYTFATVEGERATARTAAIGRDALLIVQVGDGPIELEPIPHDQTRVRLVAALPATPAARVHSASCAPEDLEAVVQGGRLPPSGSASDAKRIARWLEHEHTGRGPLHVAIRDGVNSRRTSAKPHPQWVDTEQGRLLLSRDERGWLNLTGADLTTLAGHLDVLEQRLRG
ncbi:MAG: ESX secretion-associated protein EspG [Thermocrispum sp.]